MAVFILFMALLIELIFISIHSRLQPYEAGFYRYGWYLTIAFIALLWGSALDERLHRMERDKPKSKEITR